MLYKCSAETSANALAQKALYKTETIYFYQSTKIDAHGKTDCNIITDTLTSSCIIKYLKISKERVK